MSTLPTPEPPTSFERLHLASTRLFVIALYRPILRPVLRWLDHRPTPKTAEEGGE